MLKVLLTNKLANVVIKKMLIKYLTDKLGNDADVSINDLLIEEVGGDKSRRLGVKLDMELSSQALETFIHNL